MPLSRRVTEADVQELTNFPGLGQQQPHTPANADTLRMTPQCVEHRRQIAMLTQMVKVRDETLAASKAEMERLRNELQAAQRRHSDELDRMVTGLKSQVSRLETSSRQNTALLLQHLTSLPQRVADHHHANANKRNRDEGADSPSKRLRLDGDGADGVVGANDGLRLDGHRAEGGVGADGGPQLPEFDDGDAAGGLELGGVLELAGDNPADDNAPVDANLDNIKALKEDGSLVE